MREPGYLKLVSTRFFTGKDSDCSFGAAYNKGERESWVLGKMGSGKLWGSMWQERLDSLEWHRAQGYVSDTNFHLWAPPRLMFH